jgi:hypothetical protein
MEGGDGESVRLGGGEGRGYFWSAAHQPSSPSSLNGAGMISEYLRKHHAVLIQRPVVRACVRVFLLIGWASASVGGWVGGWVQKTLRGVPTCGNGSGLMLRGRRRKHSHQSGVDCGGRVRARVSRRPNGGWRVKLTPRGNSRMAQP